MGVAVLRGVAVLAGYVTATGRGPREKTPFRYKTPFLASLLGSWKGSNRTGAGGRGTDGDAMMVVEGSSSCPAPAGGAILAEPRRCRHGCPYSFICSAVGATQPQPQPQLPVASRSSQEERSSVACRTTAGGTALGRGEDDPRGDVDLIMQGELSPQRTRGRPCRPGERVLTSRAVSRVRGRCGCTSPRRPVKESYPRARGVARTP